MRISLLAVTPVLLVLAQTSLPLSRVAAEPWPLGTVTPDDTLSGPCPSGYICSGFVATAPHVTVATRGFLAVAAGQGSPRGLVVFFTGGRGTGWWSDQPEAPAFADRLRGHGFTIVQVRWLDSWLVSSPGNDAGTAHLGGLPAAVIRHVYENYYLPLGVPPHAVGEAGFCVSGNSGGSSQTAYALSHFGLDTIIDVAIPTGGPPHSALGKSLMDRPGEEAYWYPLSTRQFIDEGFGYLDGNGPGANHDSGFVPRWLEESVATGGNDYFHPATRVHFIIGAQDLQMQTVAGDYVARLRNEGTPFLAYEIAPNTPHRVLSTREGQDALHAAILGTTAVGVGGGPASATLALLPSWPNPFRGATRLTVSHPVARHVKLAVFDVLGRSVGTLVDGVLPAGRHEFEFRADALRAGVYLAVASSDGAVRARKLLLLE